ncbi:uncharacterized protein C2orf78-like [Nannospalax galili]|uniref:uncharacterized protein C2orf78-like n=1 Tax=Nannospalax galili TaxID=1026970 RepID=UPI00111BFFD5|nr:uncharacterized protein C2orf78-like [Nannospalax galili]
MSDNSQNAAFLRRADALQLSLPVESSATPLGSVVSFSTVCSPASQISTSAVSYTGVLQWNLTGRTDHRSSILGDITVTITDQDTTVSSMSVTAQCDQVSDRNVIVPLYPALPASRAQGSASQRTGQGHSRSLSSQEGSQPYCYHPSTPEPLLAGELRSCLQSYGSRSYTGSMASAPQPELVMVLKANQPTDIQPPGCTSAIYHPMPAQFLAETTYNGMNPRQDDAATPNIQQSPSCFDAESWRQKPTSHNASFGNNIQGIADQGTFENGIESSIDFEDITTIVADIHLPQLLNSLTDLNQFQYPIKSKAKDATNIQMNQAQEESTVLKTPVDYGRKNKNTDSQMLDGAPQAKVKCQDSPCLVEGSVAPSLGQAEDSAWARERPPENTAKHSDDTAQKATSNGHSKAKRHRQEKNKMSRENNTKTTKECKQAKTNVKAEEKPAISKSKRKRNPPELSKDCFKKPRTHLGMHMLESVQVFHALGNKTNRKTGLSSSRAVGNPGRAKELRPCPAVSSQLGIPHERKGPEKTQGPAQNPESTAGKECPSPSQDQLPPPGKVKLVPLPFFPLDKPQVRKVPRRPLSLASRKPVAAYSAGPHSNSAQPPTVNPSQPAADSTSVMGLAKPAVKIPTNNTTPGVRSPTQSSTIPQSAASKPTLHKTSSYPSLQKEPVSAPLPKAPLPLKPQSQYLLEDFSRQPIPWRKVDIPGPAISYPITAAQRSEREAMKRQAQ